MHKKQNQQVSELDILILYFKNESTFTLWATRIIVNEMCTHITSIDQLDSLPFSTA